LTITDAAGTVVAQSTASPSAGMSQIVVDLTSSGHALGDLERQRARRSRRAGSGHADGQPRDADVAQLTKQTRVSPALPSFTPTGTSAYFFQPVVGRRLVAGRLHDRGWRAVGRPRERASAGVCQTGSMGYAVNYGAGMPASFTGVPLGGGDDGRGLVTLKLYLNRSLVSAWQAAQNPRISLEVDAVDANGALITAVASGEWSVWQHGQRRAGLQHRRAAGRRRLHRQHPAVTIPAGARLSVLVETAVAELAASGYAAAATAREPDDAGFRDQHRQPRSGGNRDRRDVDGVDAATGCAPVLQTRAPLTVLQTLHSPDATAVISAPLASTASTSRLDARVLSGLPRRDQRIGQVRFQRHQAADRRLRRERHAGERRRHPRAVVHRIAIDPV